MRKPYTLLSVFLLVTFSANAQLYTVSGKVTDEQKAVMPFVNVSLLKAADSSWLQTVQTDENGKYLLKDIAAGRYIVDVQLLGYTPVKQLQEVTDNLTIPDIILKQADNKLNAVVITGHKDLIQTELGKTVVNVRESMKQGANLLELLGNMPGVTVGADGTISMNGKQGLVVLIDDKPTYMSGKELAEYLKSVNASEVAKVELITQPSAKYDAAGDNGIISMKMNKKKKDGWSGVATGNYQQGKYLFVNAGSNIAYRNNKMTYSLNPGYYYGVGYLISDETRIAKNEDGSPAVVTTEHAFRKEQFPDYSLQTGVDYDVTDKTTLSMTAKGIYHTNNEIDKTNSVVHDNTAGSKVYNNSRNENGHIRSHGVLTFFGKHEIDSTSDIQVNAGYFINQRKIYQRINSTNYDEQGVELPDPLILNNSIPDKNRLLTAKVDYTTQPAKDMKLECGAKTSYAYINEANIFDIYVDDNWIKDTLRSNTFLYKENITAAYVSSSLNKDKWQAQAGIRVEHTHATGNQVTQDIQFTKNYTNVFPTAYVTYKADSNNTFELNYGRRLQRPYYRELNPFSWVTSQYNVKEGNPLLNPQFTHNIELKHNYKGSLITTASCSQVNGVFTDRLRYNKATNVAYSSTGNNGRKFSGALSAFYNDQLFDWLNLSVGGNVFYAEFEADYNGEHYFARANGVYMSLDTQFTFKKGWNAHFHTRYAGPYRTSVVQRVSGSGWVNSTVTKNLFEDTVTVKASVQDPFHWYRYNGEIDQAGLSQASTTEYNTQTVALGFTYNFGKRDELRRQERILEDGKRM
ncbi:MAG: TonB-dependent receptor [Chitinophagaceae bacterium]|nr:TonB-dependent receptor [Chitinophagaceae bacterium]MCB9045655.1 TonB-dependent receptor [Chitinophagales bacterium]